MMITRLSLVFAACLVTGTALGQTTNKSLNLELSPGDVPAATGSSSAADAFPVSSGSVSKHPAPPSGHVVRASAGSSANVAPARSASAATPVTPGVWYGDHSADIAENDGGVRPSVPPCDDSTYNQPQVHGSVSTGIVSGNHIGTGSYSGGVVNVSKAFGSCEQPAGGISISVGGTTSDGFGHRWRH